MAFVINRVFNSSIINFLEEKFTRLTFQSCNTLQIRKRQNLPRPRLRNPTWLTKKNRVIHDDFVTADNREFVREMVREECKIERHASLPLQNTIEWRPDLKRTGVIARKIGEVPLWLKSGKKISTTMLQVLDNHVVKYYPPEEYDPPLKKPVKIKNKRGCLLLGAETADPTVFTKEYCGIFKGTGVTPKRYLARFFISPEAVLPTGMSVDALHFSVGNYVDVRGCTKDRGFQGVMKRHGFSGMPASHGVTKTHRRGGNIGGGGEKGRVWPGTKMPGHMGNRYRVAKGLKVWRINVKYNVLWVSGPGIPGATNSIVYVYDTILPLRRPTKPLPFPTRLDVSDNTAGDDLYDDAVHKFSDRPIAFDKG